MRIGAIPVKKHCKTEEKSETVGGGGHGEEEDEEEYGARKPMKKAGPREPTKEEKEDHEKLHIPFRNWCRHCVRGRGKEEACRKDGRTPEVAEVHLDFMFMGDEKSEKTLAMLVAKERTTKAVMGCVAPRKSS